MRTCHGTPTGFSFGLARKHQSHFGLLAILICSSRVVRCGFVTLFRRALDSCRIKHPSTPGSAGLSPSERIDRLITRFMRLATLTCDFHSLLLSDAVGLDVNPRPTGLAQGNEYSHTLKERVLCA